MHNPFKFGSIVEAPYFTDRIEEFNLVCQALNSPNHLILISPRRFGKTSLIFKVVKALNRPYAFINIQKAVNTADLAKIIVNETLQQFPLEKIKNYLRQFRIIPTISVNPVTNAMDISFSPTVDSHALLEDALSLVESVSTDDKRMIVVFDEFQEILQLEKGIDKKLRAIMQEQSHVNYVFLGSQESMMTEIFEKMKSPFFHFGRVMHLKKIPFTDFFRYLCDGLQEVAGTNTEKLAKQILTISNCHPYYTQQLASTIWDLLAYKKSPLDSDVVPEALSQLVAEHDLDFERLWTDFSRTDRRILRDLATGTKLNSISPYAVSTTYTAAKRLLKAGYLIKDEEYEVEDPFFKQWILERQV